MTITQVLGAVATASFTYLFVQRIFWHTQEVQDAAKWYSDKQGWQVRQSDLENTARYIRQSSLVFGVLALISAGCFVWALASGT
jgi:hypothetical protein